ncbi:hypothetical protein JCM8547_002654 [Rhodosporidiobolus lusitaniae]
MQADRLTDQDLVDYLVLHVEEHDAVFALYRLSEMRMRGMMDRETSKVLQNYSTKGVSAVALAVQNEETPHRRFILELLLHQLAEEDIETVVDAAIESGREWAMMLAANWLSGGKEEAKKSAEALSLSPHDFEDAYSAFLPPLPDNLNLTRCNPLPLPPPGPQPPRLEQNKLPLEQRIRIVGIPCTVSNDQLWASLPTLQGLLLHRWEFALSL